MGKSKRYVIEGAVLEIPLQYDEKAGRYMELYPDFSEKPVYTPEGHPILFTGEDACPLGEAADGGVCVDCGSCRYYRQQPGTWIGVCSHEKKRHGGQGRGPGQESGP